jgi:hypothetical protein
MAGMGIILFPKFGCENKQEDVEDKDFVDLFTEESYR